MYILYIFNICNIFILDISLILTIFQISSLTVLGESFVFVKISKKQNYLNYNF